MVPVTWVGHLKQQMSVTKLRLGPQKVHKVGQLSGEAWLDHLWGRFDLGLNLGAGEEEWGGGVRRRKSPEGRLASQENLLDGDLGIPRNSPRNSRNS